MNDPEVTYKIFLSHGSEDGFLAEDYLLPKLIKSGADVFIDRGDLIYGDDFRHIIIEELDSSNELVVLLTVTSLKRPWVFAEIGSFVTSKKRIIPIVYGPTIEELNHLGVTSLLGHITPITFSEVDDYILQLKLRAGGQPDA